MTIYPRVDNTTRVIVQGMTGRAGRMHTRMMREYGTNIVGGVSPQSDVADVGGVPVFASCRDAVAATGASDNAAV